MESKSKFFQNSNTMNGLVKFITELRACRARDLEEKRINKELANIRSKFKDSTLNGYQKKKYVCKLLYMYILGWDVDFGHLEAVHLLNSTKYSEKQIGYLSVTLMLNETHELARLVVNSIRKDLDDHNEVFNCLALHAIANMGGREMSESLVHEIYKQFVSGSRSHFVKKKAGLTLLRIYRKFPEVIPGEEWAPKILPILENDNPAVVMSAVNLVVALAQQYPDAYSGCVTRISTRLYKIIVKNEYPPDYAYYKVPAPWLLVKMLRLLQYYPPPQTVAVLDEILASLNKILNNSEKTKNAQQANAQNAVLIEAMNLAIHIDTHSSLINQSITLLGGFLNSKETNMRCLALETMAHIAALGDPLSSLKPHQATVIASLTDKDISVRRRALDLLYSMCDVDNAREIVAELLKYLTTADYEIREEMVLKIAILAEKFATEYTWYIDVIMRLMTTAGDHVSDAVWHRVVHITTNNEDLREYATYTVLQALKEPACHERIVKLGGYLLGEFGHVIVESPGCSPIDQFMALHSKFGICMPATRSLLMSTYLKFVNLFPEIKPHIVELFKSLVHVLDVELQQRACEYLAIISLPTETLLQAVCEEMPHFPERESALLVQLHKKLQDTEDVRTWTIGGKDAQTDLTSRRFTSKAAQPPADSSERQRPQAKIVDPIAALVAASSSPASGAQDLLGVDEPAFGASVRPEAATQTAIDGWYAKLLTKPSGVLYEDNVIQIGFKSEYQAQYGRIAIFLGNKLTVAPLTQFSSILESTDEMRVALLQPLGTAIPAATQLHQMYNVECVTVPQTPLVLSISFSVGEHPVRLSLKLPTVATKFVAPVELGVDDFFARWRQIGGPPREAQAVFSAGGVIDVKASKAVLSSLQFASLEAADPNPNNGVGAGIFTSGQLGKIGCLVRVEPSLEHQMFRVTVRATNEAVAAKVCEQVQLALVSST
ncbi:adaptin N terminal region-domain-containing protein [Entophlyctis helioformis]|nr:adaptin N terminal region-domain-containing protein [Entophlyctis helioformis]